MFHANGFNWNNWLVFGKYVFFFFYFRRSHRKSTQIKYCSRWKQLLLFFFWIRNFPFDSISSSRFLCLLCFVFDACSHVHAHNYWNSLFWIFNISLATQSIFEFLKIVSLFSMISVNRMRQEKNWDFFFDSSAELLFLFFTLFYSRIKHLNHTFLRKLSGLEMDKSELQIELIFGLALNFNKNQQCLFRRRSKKWRKSWSWNFLCTNWNPIWPLDFCIYQLNAACAALLSGRM